MITSMSKTFTPPFQQVLRTLSVCSEVKVQAAQTHSFHNHVCIQNHPLEVEHCPMTSNNLKTF